jgi:hypothetical protein
MIIAQTSLHGSNRSGKIVARQLREPGTSKLIHQGYIKNIFLASPQQ